MVDYSSTKLLLSASTQHEERASVGVRWDWPHGSFAKGANAGEWMPRKTSTRHQVVQQPGAARRSILAAGAVEIERSNAGRSMEAPTSHSDARISIDVMRAQQAIIGRVVARSREAGGSAHRYEGGALRPS